MKKVEKIYSKEEFLRLAKEVCKEDVERGSNGYKTYAYFQRILKHKFLKKNMLGYPIEKLKKGE